MKSLLSDRMESLIITMHALQMKEQPIKFEDISKTMDWDRNITSRILKELKSRELVLQVGKARQTIYHLTKKAEDAIERKALAAIVKTHPQEKPQQHKNKIDPSHVGFMKQMNLFLKEHEALLEENKSLKEENNVLKTKLNQIKNLFN